MSSLLPPNATPQERTLETVTARIGDVPVPIADLRDPMKCPETVLPFLAWAMSVDHWDTSWPLLVKRQVVAAAIAVHQVKGTLGAIEDALAALDLDTVVTESFDYGGDPYLFKVDVNLQTRGLTDAEYSSIEAVVRNAKNARSHLDALTVHLTNSSPVPSIAATIMSGETIAVWPYALTELIQITPVPAWAMAVQTVETVTVHPQ